MSQQLTTTRMETKMTTKKLEKTYDQKELAAIKQMFAANLTEEQFKVYLMTCSRLNLDPVAKHIYGIARGGKLTIQIGIDGFRFIADRTGAYAPGETEYIYDKDKKLIGAKVWVKKIVQGQAFSFSETAFFSEYKPKQNDSMWKQFPHTMIAKCAEAKALRRAFPNEFCGVYSKEEMSQASYQEIEETDAVIIDEKKIIEVIKLSNAQMQEIKQLVSFDTHIIKRIVDRFSVLKFSDLLESDFDIIKDYASKLAISPLQLNNLVNIVASSNDAEKFEKFILSKCGIEKLSEINQRQYKNLTALIQKRQRQNGDQNETSQLRAENA
jgi:phage recombination protein Bet